MPWIYTWTSSNSKLVLCTEPLFKHGCCVTSVIYNVCFFFQELEEIRRSGMKNFRNIQVEESNLLSWQGLIVPVSSHSLFDCSAICWLTVSFTDTLSWIPGQPSLWQRCVQNRNHFPHRVPFQASQDHIQDKDLSPQHRWEGPGVLARDQRRELEACHQNWPRWVC